MAGLDVGVLVDPLVLFTLFIIGGTVFLVYWNVKSAESEENADRKEALRSNKRHQKKNEPKAVPKKKVKELPNFKKGKPSASKSYTHPHLLSNLKGHTSNLTGGDFSSDGKHFITASEDRTVLVWKTSDFSDNSRQSVRCSIKFDHANHVCWRTDSKSFVIYKNDANALEIYKLTKVKNEYKGAQSTVEFPAFDVDCTVLSLGVSINGKFIITCDSKNQITIWDHQGGVLDKFDPRHGDTYSASISPDGRFILTTGFTPDAKVWEVKFSKSGTYESVKRAFDLKGHSSGIFNCGVNCDSTKMVTVSKDGTWRLYNTAIEYEKGQEAYLLHTGTYEKYTGIVKILLSPDGRTIALSAGPSLHFYSAISADFLYSIKDIYADDIIQIHFDPASEYLLTVGERHVRIFHNVAGYHTRIQDLERSKVKATTAGMRERIDVQLKEAKQAMKRIKNNIKENDED